MPHSPAANDLIRSLPQGIQDKWLAQGKALQLKTGALIRSHASLDTSMYFPMTAVLAWMGELSDGTGSAIALVGHDGMVELEHSQRLSHQLMVLHGGEVLQVPARVIRVDEQVHPGVQALCAQNLQALMARAEQTAICNQHHTLTQRLSRMLLAIRERANQDALHLTHQQLADLMGTRRERISHTLSELQSTGAIECTRGTVRIKDAEAMRARVCDCCASTPGWLRLVNGQTTEKRA